MADVVPATTDLAWRIYCSSCIAGDDPAVNSVITFTYTSAQRKKRQTQEVSGEGTMIVLKESKPLFLKQAMYM